jgi:hypothetical protein
MLMRAVPASIFAFFVLHIVCVTRRGGERKEVAGKQAGNRELVVDIFIMCQKRKGVIDTASPAHRPLQHGGTWLS